MVVQNGEIYNYAERGTSSCATAMSSRRTATPRSLAHLYERDGLAFAERLRGMFAIALWDAARGRLVLARDPYGIKPLTYRWDGAELLFASDLRALPRAEIDVDALEAFLAFNSVPSPLTIFRATRRSSRPATCSSGSGRSRGSSASRGRRRSTLGTCGARTPMRLRTSYAAGCATACARTSSATCRSASSRAGSTPRC